MILVVALLALQWTLGPFKRPVDKPVISPDPAAAFADPMSGAQVAWEHDHTFNPAAIVRDGKVLVLYRAEDNSGAGIGGHTSRIGLATSEDGLHFTKRPTPVLFPDKDKEKERDWPGGCEDPRVVEAPDGSYVMMYTEWNRVTARLAVATSTDLVTWIKRGPAFQNVKAMKNAWSKSGSVVCRVVDGRLMATMIGGTYWMYWGEGTVHAARSVDLVHWTPVSEGGRQVDVLVPREGKFDSALCEPGPPAVMTNQGIVLLYNGKNAESGGEPTVGPGAYSAGQALLDPKSPATVLQRTDTPFFKPELAFEKTGQYKQGTVFIEGLVWFRSKWLLYYGTADSFVGVAQSGG